jgi:hypothetical protein
MSHHSFIKDRLVTMFFHGTRKHNIHEYVAFENELSNLLKFIQDLIHRRNIDIHPYGNTSIDKCDDFDNAEYGFYLQTIFRMILHTRNAYHGKGERYMSYCMVYAMYTTYPAKAMELLNRFVMNTHTRVNSFELRSPEFPRSPSASRPEFFALPNIACDGGWIDMKKMADYVYIVKNQPTSHPIIRYCVLLTNTQLYIDKMDFSSGLTISDVAVWIPREKSAYAWFFCELANDWGVRHKPYYFRYANTIETMQRAIRKNTTQYRKMVSHLSRRCSTEKPIRSLSQFVGDAMRLLENGSGSTFEIDQLNNDWTAMIQTHDDISIGNVLPVLDISLSMKEDNEVPLRRAIGVTCFLLEKTSIEKRIVTIDQTPSWIVVPPELPFVRMVEMIRNVVGNYGGTNKNVFRTMDVLANSFAGSAYPVDDIRLVVISDMKFTHFRDTSLHFPVDEYIRACFLTVPYSTTDVNTPSYCPHITYWNVGISKMYPTEEYTLPCDYHRWGSTVVSGDVGNVARFILPEWHVKYSGRKTERELHDLPNQYHMVANTPFDAMCSGLSFVS